MKIRNASFGALMMAWLPLGTGCDWMPGRPVRDDLPPDQARVVEFQKLYQTNCMACHSDGTTFSAARPMNDPVYLAFAGADNIQRIIEEGVEGTTMPAFATDHGGELTEEQIGILVEGIMKWADADKVPDAPMPPYSAPLGDIAAGGQAYGVSCAHCHGADGRGGQDGSDILDPAFLGLVSDQNLRTAVVAGRHDLGMPDWTDYVEDRVMSDQEISDLVAWMVSHRRNVSRPATAPTDAPSAEPTPDPDGSGSEPETTDPSTDHE